ncbi:MAG: pyruvate ferredoxin oxidoreductase [bacterium]|nr:pyruvate ferredoxin oxidoreductase [bacterium]MBU1917638.1 pyruvate ferredoxin oxidoreductase [bacterium]
MKKVLMGNHAASWAVKLADVKMIAAYPITPQTQIVEELSEMCGSGELKAKFLKVESEHSAMASCIAASSAGVRAFTATSANGLALMHELLHWASGARLPLVMVNVNRAMAPGWNIWADQSDSLSQRDTGWLQLYVEDNQEVLDTVLQAYYIAEKVNLPVMVCYDAFFLSHTYEAVDIPEKQAVQDWLPPHARENILNTKDPRAFNGLVMPDVYMEMRYKLQQAHEEAVAVVKEAGESFAKAFDRSYSTIETVYCDDAETVLVTSSSTTSPARLVVEALREKGMKIGLMKVRLFRPFPVDDICQVLSGKKKVVVIDRNISFGKGGIFADEIRGAIANDPQAPIIFGYITGLGGRDITPELVEDIVMEAEKNERPERLALWKGLKS